MMEALKVSSIWNSLHITLYTICKMFDLTKLLYGTQCPKYALTGANADCSEYTVASLLIF